MSVYTSQDKGFYKCLLLDNVDRSGVSNETISGMEKENLEVFYCTTIGEAETTLRHYSIYLLMINIKLFPDLIAKIPKEQKIKVIIMLDANDITELENIMENPSKVPKNLEIVDYFFVPVDQNLFLHRVHFLVNQEKTFSHLTECYLEKYIWETIHHQTQQLHNVIWKKNYNHYILTKHVQYLSFFFHILSLLNQDGQNLSMEYIIDKTINNIELQMCFFNSYITFKTEGASPSHYTEKLKCFLLFLIFLAELLKINMINTELTLKFFSLDRVNYVSIEMDASLNSFVERYNMMNPSKYHLFHYLQEYLWEHWQKNITFTRAQPDTVIGRFAL